MAGGENVNQRKWLRSMRQVVIQALSHYQLQVNHLRFLAQESNTYFQFEDDVGEKYVVRIYSENETTLQDNQTELFWLKSLARDTDLCITEPIPDRDGRYLCLVQETNKNNPKRCAVFKWVPGRSLSCYLSPKNYQYFGKQLARLHQHAETLELPVVLQPRKWDRIFYFPNEPDLIHDRAYDGLFPRNRVLMLDQVMQHAETLLEDLYAGSNPPILIHSDLHFWNVRIHRGDFYLMDFESVLLGYPVQDISVTLYYGMERKDYDELKSAFEDGYRSLRPWPVASSYQLETLWAARTVNFINYSARIDPDPLDYIERRCGELWQYLDAFGG